MYKKKILGLLASMIAAAAFALPAQAIDALAVINGEPVSYDEFERLALTEARQTFYHGSPPGEEELIEFRRSVADKLVERKLKLRDARDRGLQPDDVFVNSQLSVYEDKYGDTPRWKTEGEAMLARLRAHFNEQSLLQQIDVAMRSTGMPGDGDVQKYYEQNLEKFTEPEQVRVSIILLQVPPWAGTAGWDAAEAEARKIAGRIRDGGSFVEAAKLHSADPTAAKGGDMGFVHAGVLNTAIHAAIEPLNAGEMAQEPITVLEGVVLLRLEERRAASVRPLDAVRERAIDLWRRESGEVAYETYLERLRSNSTIDIDNAYLARIPDQR